MNPPSEDPSGFPTTTAAAQPGGNGGKPQGNQKPSTRAVSTSANNHERMIAAWNRFVNTHEIDECVQPLVATSWKRCWARVNPNKRVKFQKLNPEHILTTQVASFDLISIARPILEDIYQSVENSGTGLILTNPTGCVLDTIGDPEILQVMQDWEVGTGAILTEDRVGTNSIGMAIIERMPVQVSGAEHYVRQFHDVNGAAAPVFDPTGHLLGVLGVVMPLEKYHSHSLGLATAGARAIESQHQADNLLMEHNSQLSRLNAVLSAISDGILVWSANRILMHANNAACQILNLPLQSLVGRKVDSLFTIPPYLIETIGKRQPVNDVEVNIQIGVNTVHCLISLNYVFARGNNALQWVIATLRTEKQVRKLVQNQLGASATLTLEDIPGESAQIQRLRQFVRSAAGARASILIRGEIGTGKNALASAIHNASPRRDGPFIIFACASVPSELALAELLGVDEPTGLRRTGSRPSKFELAQGGTLFFQNVDALPLEAQAALLNMLELGVVQRLGSQRPIEVDVRVIASTSVDIESLIAQGAFRTDLFYRLSTFTITIPPLRDRPTDIPQVVERILKRLSNQLGHPVLLGPGVMEVLKKHPWRGNVRELEATLGRCATQSEASGVISLEQLPTSIRYVNRLPDGDHHDLNINSLTELERNAIMRTAQLCRGNLTLMAEALGIGRTTLWRHMKAYGINPQDYRKNRNLTYQSRRAK